MIRKKSPNEIMIVNEKQLLLNSSLIDEHKYLKPLLDKFDKIFKDDLEKPEYKVYFTDDIANFLRYTFNTLMEAVVEEWEKVVFLETVDKGAQPCQLCGNKGLVEIHKIKNKKTNKELLVGSDCIDKFSIGKDIEVSQSMRKMKKDKDSLRRRTEINVQIPNISEILPQWHKALNENPIVLPIALETDTKAFLDEADMLCKNYIDGKDMRKSIARIEELVPIISGCFDSIESFNNENKEKSYICSRTYKKWIIDKHGENSKVLYKIKVNGGFICNETIKAIHDIAFVRQHISLIEEHLSEHNLKFVKDEGSFFYFNYKRDEYFSFELVCSSKAFMEKCAELHNGIFSINIDEFKKLLKFSESAIENNSPINFCNELIRATGYYIFRNDDTMKYFVVKRPNHHERNSGEQYSEIKLKHIRDNILNEIQTKSDDELLKILEKWLSQLKNWKSREEYKELTSIDNQFLHGERHIYRKPRR